MEYIEVATAKTKVKTEGATGRRGRPSPWPDTAKIKLLVKENPKRKGTKAAKVFDLYQNNMTVAQAREAGIPTGHMQWDLQREFISIAA